MNITITGMIGKRKEKALLKEAAEFFASQLMDPRLKVNASMKMVLRILGGSPLASKAKTSKT